MNLLFIVFSLDESTGGVERVSDIISKGLRNLGHNCYALYETGDSVCSQYIDTYKVDWKAPEIYQSLNNYIKKNKINVVVNQRVLSVDVWETLKRLKINGDFKLYSFLHTTPDFYDKIQKNGIFIKLIYNFYKIIKKKYIISLIKDEYNISDKLVLLSEKYVSLFINYYGIKDNGAKLYVIHNPIGLTQICNFGNKEKNILIVSRLSESDKRLSRAIKIWSKLESNIPDWKLIVVGGGSDEMLYRSMVKNYGLKNIVFTGHIKNPLPYYERAEIFIMTSDYEGWSMTIIEAMAMGVVPVVYDTFIALHEIIEDHNNGFIVKKNDINTFVNIILFLINNPQKRRKIQEAGIESTRRYLLQNILRTWEELLNTTYAIK